VTVAGVDLSDHCTSVQIPDSADEVEVTGFKQTYREYQPGLKDATVDLTFIQDRAASSVDETLYPLYANQTAGTVKVNPDTSGTVVYTLVGKIYSYSPVNGSPGDASTVDVTIRNSGTAGLTRGTA
jgi:hypothetical protein